MRLKTDDPFGSYYTLTGVPGDPLPPTLKCDQTWVMGNTAGCDNTIAFLSLLREHAQKLRLGSDDTADIAEKAEDPSQDLIASQARLPVLADLAGKRALILGDSVDRNTLYHFQDGILNDTRYFSGCDMDDSRILRPFNGEQGSPRMIVIPILPLPTEMDTSEPFNFEKDVDVNHSLEDVLEGAEVEASGLIRARAMSQLRIDFLHMYGTDDDDLWEDRQSHQGVTAWRSQDRLEKVKSMWGAAPDTYDAVFVNFGLWELARYQREAYTLHSTDDQIGLPQDWLEDYKERLRAYVERIQSTWLHAKVVIRTIHDPHEGAGGWFRSATMSEGGERHAPFTRLRVVQLRRAQLQVAAELELEVLNWADHMIGQDGDSWLRDDIHPAAAGSYVLGEMYLRSLAET
jgi:hypothetical protein